MPPTLCDTEDPLLLSGSPGGPGGAFYLYDPNTMVYTPLPGDELDPADFDAGVYDIVYVYNLPGVPAGQAVRTPPPPPSKFSDGPDGTAAFDLAVNEDEFCLGDSTIVTVTVDPTGPDYDFAWTQNGLSVFGNDSIVTITQDGFYNVMITNTVNGCADTLDTPIDISVNDTPTVALDVPVTQTCDEDTIVLTVQLGQLPDPERRSGHRVAAQ